jgi:hypothetical protein
MPNNSIAKHQIPLLLAQRFIREYDEVAKTFSGEDKLKITEHFLTALHLQEQYQQTKDEVDYKKYADAEQDLLRQYGAALKLYRAKQFHVYFDGELVVAEKDIYPTDVFNKLPPEEQSLPLNAMEQFIRICTNTLQRERDNLLLSDVSVTNDTLNAKEGVTLNGKEETLNDNQATKARQLLAMYYLFKTIGIEHRANHSVSAIARFVHLLTGTKFTSIQNSDIYKKYLLMPNYKQGETLIKDLTYIRDYFTEAGLEEAVLEIDAEISRCVQELPLAQRKKWQSK